MGWGSGFAGGFPSTSPGPKGSLPCHITGQTLLQHQFTCSEAKVTPKKLKLLEVDTFDASLNMSKTEMNPSVFPVAWNSYKCKMDACFWKTRCLPVLQCLQPGNGSCPGNGKESSIVLRTQTMPFSMEEYSIELKSEIICLKNISGQTS